MYMNLENIKLLTKLGLDEKCAKAYLALLGQGKTTYTNLSKLAQLNRATTYNIVDQLKQLNLASVDLGGPVAFISANPPEQLHHLLLQAEKDLELKKRWYKEALSSLALEVKHARFQSPKIQFTEEKNLTKFLHQRSPTWNASLLSQDATWWGYNDPTTINYYQDWITWYWKEYGHLPIYVKLLTSKENAVEVKLQSKGFQRRQIKFWEKSLQFTGSTWIVGDFIVLVNTQNRPHYLVEINDPVLAHNHRELFKGIWESIP
jgi:sugar-specific transcriptional regulator TrmB